MQEQLKELKYFSNERSWLLETVSIYRISLVNENYVSHFNKKTWYTVRESRVIWRYVHFTCKTLSHNISKFKRHSSLHMTLSGTSTIQFQQNALYKRRLETFLERSSYFHIQKNWTWFSSIDTQMDHNVILSWTYNKTCSLPLFRWHLITLYFDIAGYFDQRVCSPNSTIKHYFYTKQIKRTCQLEKRKKRFSIEPMSDK